MTMRTLLREISLRHLSHSPLRSLLVVFGIALGVSMLSAVLATNASLLAAFEDMVDRVAGKADLTIAAGSAGIPGALASQVSAVEGVEHAAAMVEVVTRSTEPGSGSLLLLGVDFLGDTFFLPFAQPGEQQVVHDPLAFVNDPTAVLVPKKLAAQRGLVIGSPLSLLTPEGEKTFRVRGLLEDTGPAASFGGQVVVMFIDALQVSFGRGTLVDRIDVAVAEGAALEDVERRLQQLVQGVAEVERPGGRSQRLVSALWVFQNGLKVSGMVALWVSMFLIYNAVAVSVAQRRREVGILRALGVTKRTATQLFCLEALIMATFGAALGLLVGEALAGVALENVRTTIHQFILPIHPPPPELTLEIACIAVAAGLLTTVLAAYLPARKSASIDPAEALRATRASSTSARVPARKLALAGLAVAACALVPARLGGETNGYLASTILLCGLALMVPASVMGLRRLVVRGAEHTFGIPARLALDNVERSLGRSAVTVIALMLAVSMSVTVAGYARSFERSILDWADGALAADGVITAGSPLVDRQHVTLAPSILTKLDGVPGIAAVNPVRIMQVDLLGKRVELASTDTELYFRELARRGRKLTVLEGPEALPARALAEAPRVLISENLSRTRGLSVGDRIELTTPAGARSFEVLAVVVDYSSDQGWMMMDRQYYQAYFHDTQADSIDLFFEHGADAAQVADAVRVRLGSEGSFFVTLHEGIRQHLKQVAKNAFALARAPELITLLVAMMGVIGTMLASVIDRIREIGVLRAIGALRRQVVTTLVFEAGFLGLSAAVCGVAAGVPQGYIFLKVIGTATSGWNLSYRFPLESAVRVFLVIVVISALAGLLPGLRAARLAVRDALSYE